MRKNRKLVAVLLLAFTMCACGTGCQKGTGEDKTASRTVAMEAAKDAYFLDDNTLFITKIPAGWTEFDLSDDCLRFICIDSEIDGFWDDNNYFYIDVRKMKANENYDGYEQLDFEYADGQKGLLYSKEYKEELWDEVAEYRSEVLVLPDWRYVIRAMGYRDFDITPGRYQRNREQFDDFYKNIAYQVGEERIGQKTDGAIDKRDKIRLHIDDDMYLNCSVIVPEGISYKKEFLDEGDAEELFFRFFLDDTGVNYVELHSDKNGRYKDYLIADYHNLYEVADGGELFAYYDYVRDSVHYGLYSFKNQETGVRIFVEEDKPELFELALKIVKSVRF